MYFSLYRTIRERGLRLLPNYTTLLGTYLGSVSLYIVSSLGLKGSISKAFIGFDF